MKTPRIILAGILASGLAGCSDVKSQGKKTIELGIGRGAWLPGSDNLEYCGMPNSNTFSLTYSTHFSVNYYYPRDARKIKVREIEYEVMRVSPEKIVLTRGK